MKKYILTLVTGAFLLFPLISYAQLLEVKQTVFGMDCAPCAYGLEQRIQGLEGVQSAKVSLNEGLLVINLKENNRLRLKEIRKAVVNSGFLPKKATITVAGKVIQSGNGGYILETTSQEHFVLKAEDKSVFNKVAGTSHYVITGKVKIIRISESGSIKLSIQNIEKGKA